ncbi:hypothetical protein H1Z61_17610 [Bacillus aquiflavi]|uniref:Uncharacterized protein n=1 Tax=Bacillus aquiflavi TaxID=2672567 RepID=A0A6B3VY74_9BACI|nr:hypothetical protein [Bacillus aquiflavi]MBA4538860.1 hypothetical protein [Bacillus aquiflavi]NEY83220.1 hypothetical protein [Bacillus aquiflavi]
MNPIRTLKNKIKNNDYTLEDLENGLSYKNEFLLYLIMFEIAKKKLVSDKIIESLKDLVNGHEEISDRGVGNFTMRVVACATLKKLGYENEYNIMENEKKQWVDAILSDKVWKDI